MTSNQNERNANSLVSGQKQCCVHGKNKESAAIRSKRRDLSRDSNQRKL